MESLTPTNSGKRGIRVEISDERMAELNGKIPYPPEGYTLTTERNESNSATIAKVTGRFPKDEPTDVRKAEHQKLLDWAKAVVGEEEWNRRAREAKEQHKKAKGLR